MFQHCILTYSDYNSGQRIGLYRSYSEISRVKEFLSEVQELKDKYKHVKFGMHHLLTQSKSWESVIEYDKFFCDVTPVYDIEQFKKYIEGGIKIQPIDIAKLMITKKHYTNLQIEKLIYFFYCAYLEMFQEEIFDEDFQAWQYGPVIPSVYDELKRFGRSKIGFGNEKDIEIIAYSRLIKTPQYDKIIQALDRVMQEYGDLSASVLVDKSHIEGGPWDIVYRKGCGNGNIIPKKMIREYLKA